MKIKIRLKDGDLRSGRPVHFTDPEWAICKDQASARGISNRSAYIRKLIHDDGIRIRKAVK